MWISFARWRSRFAPSQLPSGRSSDEEAEEEETSYIQLDSPMR